MIKHIYLNTSNLEHARDLRDDENFEGVPEYSYTEIQKTHRNEYGRIKTGKNVIHFLLGQIQQNECPWCGYSAHLKKLSTVDGIKLSSYCLQCNNCGARGPILNVNSMLESDKNMMEEVENIMRSKFSQRIPWDKDIINHTQ